MSKEAMKLALGKIKSARDCHPNAVNTLLFEAEEILEEALEKPDFWEGYVPEPDNTCNNALRAQGKAYPRTCKKCGFGPCVELAQQALDKKAENARELGLDYEPVWGGGPTNKDYEDAMRQRRLHQLTPPTAQRKWQGLTDEERKLVRNSVGYNQFVTAGEYAEHVQKATEFKLLEKNT